MLHSLLSESALAFVGVRFVDEVEIGAQADLARAHLCNDRADRSGCSNVYLEDNLGLVGAINLVMLTT